MVNGHSKYPQDKIRTRMTRGRRDSNVCLKQEGGRELFLPFWIRSFGEREKGRGREGNFSSSLKVDPNEIGKC